MKISIVADEIVKSKKFSRLDKDFVVKVVKRFLSEDISDLIEKGRYRSKKYKNFLKEVRKFLHDVYGVYQVKDADRKDKILMKDSIEFHKKILHCHTSSRERKEHYEEIYKKIFSICKKPKRIIDFGCGLNPFSIPFMKLNNFEYFACDFVRKDLELVQKYFCYKKIRGKTILVDVFDKKFSVKNLPKADVCFLFKMAEVLDYFEKNHEGMKRFLDGIRTNFVVVSFASKTVSGKKMNNPKRKWFEKMIKEYRYDVFVVGNEIFYVIDKKH